MADEIEVVTAFPDVIEVTITDLNKMIMHLAGEKRTFTLPEGGRELIPIKFDYSINLGTPKNPKLRRSKVKHDIRAVTIETLLAGEITSRVGAIIREVLLQPVDARVSAGGFGEDTESEEDTDFGEDTGGFSRIREDRLIEIMDLSKEYPDSEAHLCEFTVLSIELQSPVTMRSRVAAVMLQVQVLTTPATTAEISTAIAATSLALQTLDMGCKITSCKLWEVPGIDVETVRKEFADERFDYYLRQLALKDMQPIQFDLKELGFYGKVVDNKFKKDLNQARKEFAISKNLNPEILPTDPVFLHKLAEAIAQRQYPDTKASR